MGFKQWSLIVLVSTLPMVALASEQVTKPLEEVAFYPQRAASATALSLNDSVISAQIQAQVDQIVVGVSQTVKQGELLLTLDCTDADLALKVAKTNVDIASSRLRLAQSQKERNDRLLTSQLTSQESADTTDAEFIARKGELRQRELERTKAAIDVSRCSIKAPFDGIVTARLVSEGQLASVGTALISITESGRLELSAQVKPNEVKQIQHAKELYFDNLSQYPVKLLHGGGVVDSATRTQEIRLQFLVAMPSPGSAGLLKWQDSRPHIDAKYIVERQNQLGVFVDQNGFADYVPLPDAVPGRPAAVSLPLSTPVVIKGLRTLQSGEPL